jgi:hypothetical protein
VFLEDPLIGEDAHGHSPTRYGNRGPAPQFGAMRWRRNAAGSTPPPMMAPHDSGAKPFPPPQWRVARRARRGVRCTDLRAISVRPPSGRVKQRGWR